MGLRKQTLGYPSRTDAVVALRRQGKSTHEIAERIGIQPKNVAALENSALRSKKRTFGNRTVVFPVEVLARLVPHANRRDVSANELARRIVEHALDDNMIDAILDDGMAGQVAP